MKRVALIAAAALLWAAPAQALSKQSGKQTMSDGVSIAYDLYEPDGATPAGGWPGVIVLHGFGGTKDSVAPIAEIFAAHGYAALAYTARGHGTSGGQVELAGPTEISDERAMFDFFAGRPELSETEIGAWGISYGGGQTWNGLAAGIPYKAADIVEAWTDLYSALWPQNVAKSGIVLGLTQAIAARSPLLQAVESDAVHSTNLALIKPLADQRSALSSLSRITAPVYMFQGRVDYTFDVTQAENGFLHAAGPRHLYIGQFGHAPSSFPGPDVGYVMSQGLAWLDHYVQGVPNGIDSAKPVTIAAASGTRRGSFAGIPPTKIVTVGFRGTAPIRTGPRFAGPLETFGVSVLSVQVRKIGIYPRLVATLFAGGRPITHGAIVPHLGLDRIRLANYVQYLPKGTRLTLRFGPDSSRSDPAYVGFADQTSISLGPAALSLQALARPVSR